MNANEVVLELLQKIVNLYGKDNVKQAIESFEDTEGIIKTQGVPPGGCPVGQTYNPILGRCVDNIGK